MCRENCMQDVGYEWCLGNVPSSLRLREWQRRANPVGCLAGHRSGAVGAMNKQHCETKAKENL